MHTQYSKGSLAFYKSSTEVFDDYPMSNPLLGKQNGAGFGYPDEVGSTFPLSQDQGLNLYKFLLKLSGRMGKKNFLVFKHNKYINVPTEKIAYFYIKYDTTIIVSFDQKEYAVNYSLEQIQELLTDYQFYRLNRQYLINFYAIKEVEHYFARKLLVTLTVPVQDKLLVSKEKASAFLPWLENR
jgi:DNA-binding LytR/AlgR family response regulator